MKKNLLKSLLTMCALGAMFTACSNEGNEAPDVTKGEKKTVFMKLDLRPQTRATEDKLNPVTTPKVPVNDLYIYFYKQGDGSIQKFLKITSSTNPSITDLTNGVQITEVPVVADKVLVRGNVPTSVTLPTAGLISAIENTKVEITTQNDKNKILLGHLAADIQTYNSGGGVAPISSMQDGDKYAVIELEPAVARIEFEGLQVKNSTIITGFDLEGIYQNNFYKNLKLGDGSSSEMEQYGADPNNYAENAPNTLFITANKEKLFDKFDPALSASSSPLAISPVGGSDKRWVYHVYANNATDANSQLQMIFKLENLQPDITIPSPQFLTVRGFKDTHGDIVKLEKGKIYTVSKSDFTFDENNLTTVPNTNAVGVWLKVTVKDWEVVTVKPNL